MNNPTHAATPEPLKVTAVSQVNAANTLFALAKRVEQLPAPQSAVDTTRLSGQEWSLHTRVSGRQAESSVAPMAWTATRDADGQGVETRRRGESANARTETYTLTGYVTPDPVTNSPEVLAARLIEQYPETADRIGRITAMRDIYRERSVPPSARATLLRYLAEVPNLTVDGQVQDRLGRAGLAVSVTSSDSGLLTRYTLILDEHTGALLGAEETLTESAGKLNVPIPSVIAYELFDTGETVPASS